MKKICVFNENWIFWFANLIANNRNNFNHQNLLNNDNGIWWEQKHQRWNKRTTSYIRFVFKTTFSRESYLTMCLLCVIYTKCQLTIYIEFKKHWTDRAYPRTRFVYAIIKIIHGYKYSPWNEKKWVIELCWFTKLKGKNVFLTRHVIIM